MNTEALESALDRENIKASRYNVTQDKPRYIITNTSVLEKESLREITACGGKVAVNPQGYLVILDESIEWE